MMIREKLVANNSKSPAAQIGDERGGVADAAECEEVLFTRFVTLEGRGAW